MILRTILFLPFLFLFLQKGSAQSDSTVSEKERPVVGSKYQVVHVPGKGPEKKGKELPEFGPDLDTIHIELGKGHQKFPNTDLEFGSKLDTMRVPRDP